MLLSTLGCAPRATSGAQSIHGTSLFTSDMPQPPRVGQLELVGAFELRSGDPEFGGISAARLAEGTLYLLSDRSTLYEVDWPEDGQGRSFELPLRGKWHLTMANGRPLDAEALVLGQRGDLLVGDETDGRVFVFSHGKTAPKGRPIRLPSAFAEGGAINQGLETLAFLPDGGLVAIVEGTSSADGRHVAVVVGEGGQQAWAYRAGDGFQVTDADVAGGWLLVLERRLSLLGGWQGRIMAVPLADMPIADTGSVAGRELAVVAGPILGENYEGLAARVETDGAIRIVIVADDNFNGYQRTQLVELRWRP